jgi:hypothetical protein
MFALEGEPSMSRARIAVMTLVCLCLVTSALNAAEGAVGDFEAQADVGEVKPAGTAQFDKDKKEYRLSSSGQNIWAAHDDFHVVYRQLTGDGSLTADVAFVGDGKSAHRKAGCMIRQSLDADAPYVDAVVHGDGSIGLQYRTEKGGQTTGVKTEVKAPATLRLERKGEEFTVTVSPKGGAKSDTFATVGSIKVSLKDPVYAGIFLSAHDATVTESAVFSNVIVKSGATK